MITTCEVGPAVKVILDRKLKAKNDGGVTTYREIYVEVGGLYEADGGKVTCLRPGLMRGPYLSAAHARKDGFILPDTTESE